MESLSTYTSTESGDEYVIRVRNVDITTRDNDHVIAEALLRHEYDGTVMYEVIALTEAGVLLNAEVAFDGGYADHVFLSDAGECDPLRGSDPKLQAHARMLLVDLLGLPHLA